MKVFEITIGRQKAVRAPEGAVPVPSSGIRGGFFGFVRESFAGAWQKNVVVDSKRDVLAFSAVFSCVTVIASDMAKMRIRLLELTQDGIWSELKRQSPFLNVLRKPNKWQNRIQFIEQWILSKLLYGNTYVLLERDGSSRVRAMYVLNPALVTPLVTPQGDVYYQISKDPLSKVYEETVVPASEIIHDRMNCFFHPLVGISPIYACGAAATVGNRVQANSSQFFENMSRPSGMLTAPTAIDDETAARIKKTFEENFGGENIGRMFVAGNGLEFKTMTMPARDAQLIEQLKWTAEDVARCFHVPLYKINAGPLPTYNNAESLNQQYLNDVLGFHIECVEVCLDEGLGVGDDLGTDLDTSVFLRMDTAGRYDAYAKAIGAGFMKPNEARNKEGLAPVKGGDVCYLQQQNWALQDLADRGNGPLATAVPALPNPATPAPTEDDQVKDFLEALRAAMEGIEHA